MKNLDPIARFLEDLAILFREYLTSLSPFGSYDGSKGSEQYF